VEAAERARETSDMLWQINKYKTIDCECGTRLRIPPGFRAPNIKCPHCGRIHPV
jgi:heat shock protein HtpX